MLEKEGWARVILGFALRLFVNVLLVLGLVEGFVYSYHFSYTLFADFSHKPSVTQTVTVTIPESSSAGDVAKLMEDYDLVDSRYLFMARMYIGNYSTRIKAGSYTLMPSMTPDEICRLICGLKQSEETT